MSEGRAHIGFSLWLMSDPAGLMLDDIPGRLFTLVNECCVDVVGGLSGPSWSTPASSFSLPQDLPWLKEWLGLQMGLVRSVGELMPWEQPSTNEGWELVDKYPSFSPSRATLRCAHSNLSKEPRWN